MTDTCRVVQLIECTVARRGDGEDDPIRIVRQYFTFDGQQVAEVDPITQFESGLVRFGSAQGGREE